MAFFDRFKKGKGGGEPPKDKQPVVKPQIESTWRVSWADLELTSKEVAQTNQELSANFGKKVALNPTKLDANITKLKMELYDRGFDIQVTGHFALKVMIEESRRAYSKAMPEYPWVVALVIEAERRIRIQKGYADTYELGDKDVEGINKMIGKMKEEAIGQSDVNRLSKLASDSPRQPIRMEDLKQKLLVEAQHLARMDMARKKLGLEKGAKLPKDALKEFLSVEVSREDMIKYFEIAKKKYFAMHGLDEKGQPKKK